MKDLIKQILIVIAKYRPIRKLFTFKLPSSTGAIALTFDDGPNASFTPLVLESLERHKIKATFFVLGSEIEKQSQVFNTIVESGNEIGIHGYFHHSIDLPKHIRMTEQVLDRYGISSRFFRPPKGKLDFRTLIWLIYHRITLVMWSFDCWDSLHFEGKSKQLPQLESIEAGDIILLNDYNTLCIKYLESIINIAKIKKLRIALISEIL